MQRLQIVVGKMESAAVDEESESPKVGKVRKEMSISEIFNNHFKSDLQFGFTAIIILAIRGF